MENEESGDGDWMHGVDMMGDDGEDEKGRMGRERKP